MDYRKTDKKFIITMSKETRDKLLYLGFTEITEPSSSTYCFLNDGKKLTFDAEESGIIFSNIMYL